MKDRRIQECEKMLSLMDELKFSEAIDLFNSILKGKESEKIKVQYKMYWEWNVSCSPEEYNLRQKAMDFEDKFFQDMILEEYTKEIATYEIDGMKVHDDYFGNIRFENSIGHEWRFKIASELTDEHGRKMAGQCNNAKRLIEISRECKDTNNTLLHEMIHAYENMFNLYKEFLMLKLYEKLSSKIPELIDIITKESNIIERLRLPYHSFLFLLKSLDLDLRLNQPLFTVYGYGKRA